MNLTLFFRLASMVIGQGKNNYDLLNKGLTSSEFYSSCYFLMPRVWAKDGFSVSLQINNGNYATSEKGYRELGHTWQDVEFGFPSEDDELLHKHSEMYGSETDEAFTAVGTVGNIPVSVLEAIFAKHGGIDWDKTISVETYEGIIKS